jgi:hypothetical protein
MGERHRGSAMRRSWRQHSGWPSLQRASRCKSTFSVDRGCAKLSVSRSRSQAPERYRRNRLSSCLARLDRAPLYKAKHCRTATARRCFGDCGGSTRIRQIAEFTSIRCSRERPGRILSVKNGSSNLHDRNPVSIPGPQIRNRIETPPRPPDQA